MTAINTDDSALQALGLRSTNALKASDKKKDEMGMDTFLELMTTQLKNQDPMKPMENGDFLGQIAQFAQVSGLQQLNTAFADLSASLSSSQALQAGNLVGKTVLTQGNYGYYSQEKGMEGELDLTASATDIKLRVYDANGVLAKTLSLGTQPSGQLPFKWDGSLDAGGFAPPGAYRLEADYFDGQGRAPLSTLVSAQVNSVLVGNNSQGLTLNLTGLGAVPFNSVSRIQ